MNATARTLRVDTTLVSVPADARIRREDTTLQLSQILVGDRVRVRGVNSGTMVTAQEIKVRGNDDDEDENEDENEVELTGAIAGKTGACPALTFSIGATTFVTEIGTLFRDTMCSALANGDRVEVRGIRQSSGPVRATNIHKED